MRETQANMRDAVILLTLPPISMIVQHCALQMFPPQEVLGQHKIFRLNPSACLFGGGNAGARISM